MKTYLENPEPELSWPGTPHLHICPDCGLGFQTSDALMAHIQEDYPKK